MYYIYIYIKVNSEILEGNLPQTPKLTTLIYMIKAQR